MGDYHVFLEAGFQGRLRQTDVMVRAEISVFRDLLEKYRLDATTVPKYSVTEHVELDEARIELSRDVQLKVRGTWTFIQVESRAPGVFVVHDRPH